MTCICIRKGSDTAAFLLSECERPSHSCRRPAHRPVSPLTGYRRNTVKVKSDLSFCHSFVFVLNSPLNLLALVTVCVTCLLQHICPPPLAVSFTSCLKGFEGARRGPSGSQRGTAGPDNLEYKLRAVSIWVTDCCLSSLFNVISLC